MIVRDNWDRIKGFRARDGITRRVFSGEKSMMVMNEIMPTAEPMTHHHPHEQLSYIVRGRAIFTLGDEKIDMSAGDLLLVPPNVPHSLKVIGSQPVLNLDVFSPIREDYLP